MKRSGQLKRSQGLSKRSTKRRTTSPRCMRQRCGKPAVDLDLCKSHLVKEADTLTSKMRRFGSPCRAQSDACLGNLQWCHVLSRRYMSVRWLNRNAVVMCAAHHAYFTHHPVEWEQQCRDWGIPWDELRVRALNDPPQDPGEVIRKLRDREESK